MPAASLIMGGAQLGMSLYNMYQQNQDRIKEEATVGRMEKASNQSADMAELASFKSSMGGTRMFRRGGRLGKNLSFYPNEMNISDGVKLLIGNPHELGGVPRYTQTSTGLQRSNSELEGGEVELSRKGGNKVISNRLSPEDGIHNSFAEMTVPVALEKAKYDGKDDQFSRNALKRLNKGLDAIYARQEQSKAGQGMEADDKMAYGGNVGLGAYGAATGIINNYNDIYNQELPNTGNVTLPTETELQNTQGNLYATDSFGKYDKHYSNNPRLDLMQFKNKTITPNNFGNSFESKYNPSLSSTLPNLKTTINPTASTLSSNLNPVSGMNALSTIPTILPAATQSQQAGLLGTRPLGNKQKLYQGVSRKGSIGDDGVYSGRSKRPNSGDGSNPNWVDGPNGWDYAGVGANMLAQGVAAYAYSKNKPVKGPRAKASLINPNVRMDAERSSLDRDYAKAISDLSNKGSDVSKISSSLAALYANKNDASAKLGEAEYNATLNNHRANAQMATQVAMQNNQADLNHLQATNAHKTQSIANYSKVAADTFSNVNNLRNEQRATDQFNAELDLRARNADDPVIRMTNTFKNPNMTKQDMLDYIDKDNSFTDDQKVWYKGKVEEGMYPYKK